MGLCSDLLRLDPSARGSVSVVLKPASFPVEILLIFFW